MTESTKELLECWRKNRPRSQIANYDAANSFSRRNYWLGIPVIVLSSIVGTTVFASLQKTDRSKRDIISRRCHRQTQAIGLAAACLVLLCSSALAEQPPGLYVIYDSSNSMWGELGNGERKYEAAHRALTDFAGGDFSGKAVALRVYGHRRPEDCRDSQLVMPFSTDDSISSRLTEAISGLRPTGRTPIDYSLREALKDFGDRAGDIVVITDGIESCDADPCALLRSWRESNVNVRVHIVGLGLSDREKSAMQCMADAAGTRFVDAQSADQLAGRLGQIREELSDTVLKLVLRDEQGRELPGLGTLIAANGETVPVQTHHRNTVPAGRVKVHAGVRLASGEVYQPEGRDFEIVSGKQNTLSLTVPRPPRVTVSFVRDGATIPGSLIEVRRNGHAVFNLRSGDPAYLAPGQYQFTASPDDFNQTVTASEDFAIGDDKTVTLKLVKTVHFTARLLASDSGKRYRENSELWRGGEKIADHHSVNGARLPPGDYEIRMDNGLIRYAGPVTIGPAPEQRQDIRIPSGQLVVRYQNPDGSSAVDKRFFISRADSKRDRTATAGKPIALTPGRYRIVGWRGDYDTQTVQVTAGAQTAAVLRHK